MENKNPSTTGGGLFGKPAGSGGLIGASKPTSSLFAGAGTPAAGAEKPKPTSLFSGATAASSSTSASSSSFTKPAGGAPAANLFGSSAP